ncbi:MAG: ECF transporter S component [Clostridia bacterium]|nr:ECF transporter S component [Clostridia bacterium]
MEEENKTGTPCTGSTEKTGWKETLKKRFSAKRIAVMAAFVALAFVVSLFDFPLFPAAPFLKLDFGNVFILLISFLLGPAEGVIVCVLKETLRIFAGSTGGVGELANMLVTSSYILLPAIVYQRRKGLKIVAFTLAAACLIGTAAALLTNRFINFPLYMGAGAKAFFYEVFWVIVAFNLIKTVAISVLTLLLYKRLSNFLKKWKI